MELTAQPGRQAFALTPTQIEARNRRLKFQRSIRDMAAQTQAAKASEAAAKLARRNLLQEVSKREAPPVYSVPAPEILVYPVIPEEGSKVVRPSMAEILAAVAKEYRVSVEELKSQRRMAHLVLARQVAMYLCGELTSHSMPVIARFIGNRDHTTVLHGKRKVARRVYREPHFASEVVALGEQISGVRR